jgi:uncharacterized peroxidase-related enzyme
MAWIATLPPENAEGELRDVYGAIGAARGGVADIHQAQSLNPRALEAHLDLYKAVMFQRGSLSRIQRERIAVVVSAANSCDYCVAHHGEALRQLGDDPALVAALGRAELPTDLPAADLSLLRWARRAAVEPAAASEADLRALRDAGRDDRAVLDAVLVVAYFSFVNRIALLPGVQVEQGFEATCGPLSHA